MKLPQVDVTDPCIFSESFAETKAYYIKDRQQFDKFLGGLRGCFEDKSTYRDAKELVARDPTPFPCWVTITEYEGTVLSAGLLNEECIDDMEGEYKAHVASLRKMLEHPEDYEPEEVLG